MPFPSASGVQKVARFNQTTCCEYSRATTERTITGAATRPMALAERHRAHLEAQHQQLRVGFVERHGPPACHLSAPAGAGLSMAQFGALARVGEAPGRSQGELAEWLGVTEGNASQVVGRLEAAGLVERRADRGAYRLFITDGGRQKLREFDAGS